MAGIGAICALIIPSVLLWKLLSAVMFRITKLEDNQGWVSTAFVVLMAVIAICLGATHPAITGAGEQQTGEWSYWAALYCLVAAAAVLLWQAVGFIQSCFSWLITAIRN